MIGDVICHLWEPEKNRYRFFIEMVQFFKEPTQIFDYFIFYL